MRLQSNLFDLILPNIYLLIYVRTYLIVFVGVHEDGVDDMVVVDDVVDRGKMEVRKYNAHILPHIQLLNCICIYYFSSI